LLSFFPFIPHSILNSEVQKVVVRYVVGGRFRVEMISLFKQCVVSTNKRECVAGAQIYILFTFFARFLMKMGLAPWRKAVLHDLMNLLT